MLVAGVDIGSTSSNAVILNANKLIAYSVVPTGADSVNSAQRAMDAALKGTEINQKDLGYIISTGYGRIIVPFANEVITEIACHAKGAHWCFESVRTILDMGGQDCKAIRCDENGHHVNFIMNDKCAAGTGRFMEVMANTLRLPLEDIGPLSLEAKEVVPVSSVCAVFAKSEVSRLVRKKIDKRDILAGLHEAVATRVYSLLKKVGIEKDFVITGGIAKNIGVVKRLEEKMGIKALLPEEPQIVGALGAALFAREKVENL